MNDNDKSFFGGICVALQCVSLYDAGSVWAEIVRSVGFDDVKKYVTKVQPDEFELTRFDKYALSEFGKRIRHPHPQQNYIKPTSSPHTKRFGRKDKECLNLPSQPKPNRTKGDIERVEHERRHSE